MQLVVVVDAVEVLLLFVMTISLSFMERYSRIRDWKVLILRYAHLPNIEAFMQCSQLY